MTWFDAILGKIYNAGSEIELGTGLNFTGALRAAANAVTGFVDVTLADTISFAKATLGSLVLTPSAPIAISSGAISAPGGYVIVDTEGATASDNLDTISTSYGGVPHVDGTVLVVSQANSSRDVTITHGVGNIKTWKGTSISLGNTGGIAVLLYRASGWQCIGSYSDATAASLAVQALNARGGASVGSLTSNGLTCLRGPTLLERSTTTYTIASGVIGAPTAPNIPVDTEGEASTDDLTTIGTSGLERGTLLILRLADSAHDVVIKHGVGNIITHTGADITLRSGTSHVFLILTGSSGAPTWATFASTFSP